MDYQVRFSSEVKESLDNIYAFILQSAQSIEIADRVVSQLEYEMLGLSKDPTIWPYVHEFRDYGVRKAMLYDYIMPFIIDEDGKIVYVIDVFHGKSDYKWRIKESLEEIM